MMTQTTPPATYATAAMRPMSAVSLDWALPEIRNVFAEEGAKVKQLEGRYAPGPLKEAASNLHNVGGVLQIIELPGGALVLKAVEDLLNGWEPLSAQERSRAAQVVDVALAAVLSYLEAVAAGEPDQPLRMFPIYRETLVLTKAARVAAADLLFPNLSGDAPVGPPTLQLSAEQLQARRARFEAGLLKFLRDPNDMDARRALRDALVDVEKLPLRGRARGFLWVAGGLFDGLANAQVPVDTDLKRLLTRLHTQIWPIIDGGQTVDERMLTDMLFHIGHAESSAGRLGQIKARYDLGGLIPADFNHPPAQATGLGMQAELMDAIIEVKRCWIRPKGETPATGEIERSLAEARAKAVFAGAGSIEFLLAAIEDCEQGRGVSAEPDTPLYADISIALLVAEFGAETWPRMEPDFDSSARAMVERLALIAREQEPPPLDPRLERFWNSTLYKHAINVALSKLRTTLHETEQRLGHFFNDPETRGELASSPPFLREAAGALVILEQDGPACALRDLADAIEYITLDVSQAPDEDECGRLAGNLAAVDYLVEAMTHDPGHPYGEYRWDDAARRFTANMAVRRQSVAGADAASIDAGAEDVPPARVEPVPPVQQKPAGPPAGRSASAPASDVARSIPEAGGADFLRLFLDETCEVLGRVDKAVAGLLADPDDAAELAALRQAFHTLKSSSESAVQPQFAHAAAAVESCFEHWIAQQRSASSELIELACSGRDEMGAWVERLRVDPRANIDSAAIVSAAESVRSGETYTDLTGSIDFENNALALATDDEAIAPAAAAADPMSLEEDIKRIGPISIHRLDFANFLNEADENIRLLAQDISEWRFEQRPASAAALDAIRELNQAVVQIGLQPVAMITEPFEQLLTLLTGATSQAFSLGPPQFDRLDAVIARMRGMLHQFAADLYPGESPEDAASIRKILELAQPRHRMPAAIARQSPAAIARQPPVAKPATPAAAPVAPVVPVAPVAPARAQPERETPTAPAAPAPAPALRADTAIPISTSGRDALASIESQLNALAARPSDQRAAAQLRRLLRIATENARARGAALLGEHLHDMESRAQGPGIYDPPSPQAIAQLKASLQKAAVLFEQSETARHPAPALETEIQLMPDDGPGTTPDLWGWNAPAPAVAPEVAPAVPAAMPAPAGRSAPAAGGQPDRSSENPESAGATKPATPTVETRADTADTARARAQAPGALLQADVEDRLAAARSALADLSSALQRLRESGRELKESTPASSAGVPVPDDVDIADVMQALSASIDEAAIAQSGLMQALEPASVAPTAGLARETSAPEPGARESVHASAPVTHPESVAVAPASETPESAAADPATDSANAPANPGNDPPLVMIVDDSLTVRRAARRFLERNGYAALEARDGRQALDYLASKQPDVVLIDIDMPDMNGFALLQQLRAEPRTRATAAVMIDTRLESKNRQLSLDHGANDYLVKPYQEQDLLGALGRCLTRPLE